MAEGLRNDRRSFWSSIIVSAYRTISELTSADALCLRTVQVKFIIITQRFTFCRKEKSVIRVKISHEEQAISTEPSLKAQSFQSWFIFLSIK